MSRFCLATIIAAAGVVALALLVRGPGRWWAMGGVALVYLAAVGLGVSWIRLGFFVPAICRGEEGANRVALTFDDGPDAEATPRLLDLLKQQRVPATFFCVGERAAAHPDLIRRMAAEGHSIGNHTFRHAWWTNFLFGRWLRDEIRRAQEALRGILGRAPRFFRSPAGLTNPHLGRPLRELGLVLVGWDVRPFDRGADPDRVAERVCRRARDGSIIVLHDGGVGAEALVRTAAAVIAALRERGYAFASLDELLAARGERKELG